MARYVSLGVLIAILLVIGVLFFRVMADFLLPLFLAVLLVIIFSPLHRQIQARCRGHDRLAAAATTAAVLLIVLLPVLLLLAEAAYEGHAIYTAAVAAAGTPEPAAAAEAPADAEDAHTAAALQQWLTNQVVDLAGRLRLSVEPAEVEQLLVSKIRGLLAPMALGTTRLIGRLLVGLFVMIVGLYYFLADGPAMIQSLMRLLPLDRQYAQQLIAQFVNVTRAVVLATLLSAFAQGLLAGFGYYFAGLDSVFLLTVLTMLLAMVPFVGSTIVWVPVCLWLFFVQDRPTAAVVLGIYCAAVVSTIDNVVKPLVLHGRSNLHPLLALLSVLGGATALGPIGIIVGPMVVAFLQSLLSMVRTELDRLDRPAAGPTPP